MPRTLFAPAVALLDRLDFRHKFLLVGVLILLPLAYLLLDLALDMADSLDTTRRELQGVALLRELTPIILDTQRHRGYINAHLGGAPGALERARQAAGKDATADERVELAVRLEAVRTAARWSWSRCISPSPSPCPSPAPCVASSP